MVQKEKRKPGRPRAYDPDAALEAALDVFWRAGFSGTSLDDLSAATGMNRPSIYAAFGDKHALYLQAIEHYREKMRVQMRAAFAAEKPLRETLTDVYSRALDLYFANIKTPLGCFLLCAVVPDVTNDETIRAALTDGLRLLDEAWRRRIQKAQDDGEIGKSLSADNLAKVAAGTLYYLSIRARAGESRENLEHAAKTTVELICRV
jgi:AcrR family transcriptional regulator